MSPEWLTAAGGAGAVVLAFLKFGYEVWEKRQARRNPTPTPPSTNDEVPPAQAA